MKAGEGMSAAGDDDDSAENKFIEMPNKNGSKNKFIVFIDSQMVSTHKAEPALTHSQHRKWKNNWMVGLSQSLDGVGNSTSIKKNTSSH